MSTETKDRMSSSENQPLVLATVVAATLAVAGTAAAVGYYVGENSKKKQKRERYGRSREPSVDNYEEAKIQRDDLIDLRISRIRPLIPPAVLLEEMSAQGKCGLTVLEGRRDTSRIVQGKDDRLVVIVGPCSIHDVPAALEYASKLKDLREELKEDLHIIMRVYFEKPRTTVGWKGLINDPDLDGSFNINKGLRIARQLLCDINEMGVPCGCEFLDTISPQFTSDLVSWGAIGARTTECQLHRELTSGLSMPVGFKNGTGGSLKLAVDAVVSAQNPHCFLSVSTQGLAAIVNTTGNNDCHVILRGGSSGPNYGNECVDELSGLLAKASVKDRVMIDCSHGNSKKIHTNQPIVAADITKRIASGDDRIIGLMIESNINAGNQKLVNGRAKDLKYGVSITDACIDWKDTVKVCKDLAASVRKRRAVNK